MAVLEGVRAAWEWVKPWTYLISIAFFLLNVRTMIAQVAQTASSNGGRLGTGDITPILPKLQWIDAVAPDTLLGMVGVILAFCAAVYLAVLLVGCVGIVLKFIVESVQSRRRKRDVGVAVGSAVDARAVAEERQGPSART